MRRKIFCAGVAGGLGLASPVAARAQQVPGRDLFRYPIGLGADSPALAGGAGGELWNPAAGAPLGTARLLLGAAALDAPQNLGVSAQLLTARFRVRRQYVAQLSVARAAVDDIVATETDPQTVSNDVPYSSLLFSAGASHRQGNLTLGAALRLRSGHADQERRVAPSLDVGAVADSLLGGRVRVGASTFLWRPASPTGEGATYVLGADALAWRRPGLAEARVGYTATATARATFEHYAHAALLSHGVSATGGLLASHGYGHTDYRPRLGVGLRYARYVVGIAREESGAGLSPTYQFMLSTSVQ